jgi:acetate kinase
LVLVGKLNRIGLPDGHFSVSDAEGKELVNQRQALGGFDEAFGALFGWLKHHAAFQRLDAVGHRIVHGGARHRHSQVITPELERELAELVPMAPEHLPNEIKGIDAVRRYAPGLPQVACFDTGFHRDMPPVAQMIPIPRGYWKEGVIRYGFHGLSYEYILGELRREAGEAAEGRIITAHLGNGSSMAALHHGRSQETTMGFTPADGLMMGTRCGDIGPGVVIYLMEEKGLSAPAIRQLLNDRSGLRAVSEISSDMQDVLDKMNEDPRAAEAVQLYCHTAKKFLGALLATLGGLDTLIFTGGIGENVPLVRAGICQGLTGLGICLDADRNEQNAPLISPVNSRVAIRVMKTNEELMIARHTAALLRQNPNHGIESL